MINEKGNGYVCLQCNQEFRQRGVGHSFEAVAIEALLHVIMHLEDRVEMLEVETGSPRMHQLHPIVP